MGRTGNRALTNALAFITAAWPRHAAKHLERSGCSPWQAERIAKTGRVPSTLVAVLLPIIDKQIAANAAKLARLQQELRDLEYEAMVERAAHRRADTTRARASMAARQAERSEET